MLWLTLPNAAKRARHLLFYILQKQQQQQRCWIWENLGGTKT